MSERESEDSNDIESQSQSISWGIGCMIALGSPIALVGVIILAFMRKGELNSAVDTGEGKARRTRGVIVPFENISGEWDTAVSSDQGTVETENGWSRNHLKSHKVGFGKQPTSRLNLQTSSVSIV